MPRANGETIVLRLFGWALPLVILTIVAASSAEWYIANLAIDDSLYYPVIARSIVTGAGSSYDGITQTNGYHPLWAWLQLPLAALVGGSNPLVYIWFLKLFMAAVIAAALLVWQRLTERVTGSAVFSSVMVMLLGGYWWSVYTLCGGMETPLVILLMGVSLQLVHVLLSSKPKAMTAVFLGISMAATLLARLDSVFFLGVLGLYVLVRLWLMGRAGRRLLAVWIIPMVMLPVPYLWWNLSRFGSIVPVSGLRKTAFRIDIGVRLNTLVNFWQDKLGKLQALLHPAGLVVLALAAIAFLYLGRSQLCKDAVKVGILWLVPVGALLHYAYTSIFMAEANVYWYQYAEYLSAFLLVALMGESATAMLRRRASHGPVRWAPLASILGAVFAMLVLYAPKKLPDYESLASYRTAVWAHDHLGGNPEARFGMWDSGIFRAVSGFRTVSLNGLAGDAELLRLVGAGDRTAIIDRYGLDFIVDSYTAENLEAIPSQYVIYQTAPYRKGGRLIEKAIIDTGYWHRTSDNAPQTTATASTMTTANGR